MIILPPAPKRETETSIVHDALVKLNRTRAVKAMRNNNGRAPKPCGACFPRLCPVCTTRLRIPVLFGLGDGSPDIVGIITIGGPRFPIAVAFGIEIKRPGGSTKKDRARLQEAWRKMARNRGMLCEVAWSGDEAVEKLESFRVEYTRRVLVLG